MKLKIFETYELLSLATAQEIIATVTRKPNAVLCLAGGDTPLRTYQIVVQQSREMKVDFSKIHFIGLDEWVGIGPDNPGSCQYFLRNNIFELLGISTHQIHLFDSHAQNWDTECRKMDRMIDVLGGIDLMLVGIGMNGHVGFNEPGVSLRLKSHVVELDEVLVRPIPDGPDARLVRVLVLHRRVVGRVQEEGDQPTPDSPLAQPPQLLAGPISRHLPCHARQKVVIDQNCVPAFARGNCRRNSGTT